MLVTENVTVNTDAESGESPAGVWTLIWPVAAPAGTITFKDVGVTFVGVADFRPPKSTRSAPPKPVPKTVIVVPVGPEVGVKAVILGSTVNEPTVVDVPPALVTEIGPVTAPAGTVTFNIGPANSANAAATPPTFTDVVPANVFPVNVTTVPVKPCVGANGSSIVGNTLNNGPTDVPPGVTTLTAPVTAPAGTCVEICVPSGEIESITAGTAPNFNDVAPSRVVPVTVTASPSRADSGT